MSDSVPSSPRKGSTANHSLLGAEVKRKPKAGRRKAPSKTFEKLPCMEEDEFSDVTIVVGDKRLYFNKCILCYNSPVFRKQLTEDGAAAGSGASTSRGGKNTASKSSKDKDLDLSDKRFDDVCELISFIDPRVETNVKEMDCYRLLPLAEEYEIKPLLKSCETSLTESFANMRKGRRAGSVATDVTMQHLSCADKYNFSDLQEMCMEELVANDNPFSGKMVADSQELSEHVKRQVLERKLDRVNMVLARERRINTERDQSRDTKGGKIWRK